MAGPNAPKSMQNRISSQTLIKHIEIHLMGRNELNRISSQKAYKTYRNSSRGGKTTRRQISSSPDFVIRYFHSSYEIFVSGQFVYGIHRFRIRNPDFVYEIFVS